MPTDDRLLDVRTEIPKRRHEIIFETFAGLEPGAAYVLVNDHDPKPLRYQLEAENAGEFTWEYLEEGPEVWRVRIGRTTPHACRLKDQRERLGARKAIGTFATGRRHGTKRITRVC